MGNKKSKLKNLNMDQDQIIDWDSITYSNCKVFSFNGIKRRCKCVKVYDPDSITLAFPFNGEIVRHNCRLMGIDAPELRSKNPVEKEHCIKGRDFLKSLILNKVIYVEFLEFDKYGRSLVHIYTEDSKSINELLIAKDFAIRYDGGTKSDWGKILAHEQV